MEKITYGLCSSPFGEMVVAQSAQGLCWLGFMVDGGKGDGFSQMRARFSGAEFVRDDAAVACVAQDILNAWEGGAKADIALDLAGTAFQQKVWRSLLKIKKGQVRTYSDIANDIGRPKAARAVGSAVGANPVSLLVPCHRVVPVAGGVGHYLWGPALKAQILAAEGQV